MSLTYNLFKTYAAAALDSNDSATALDLVNNPEGIDLAGTAADQPLSWDEYRGLIGNELAIVARTTIEGIAATKPDPTAQPEQYVFASNAVDALAKLSANGISPCDDRWRLSMRVIIDSADQLAPTTEGQASIVKAFTTVLHLGYQSHADRMFGRLATEADFEAARAVHLQRVEETTKSNREESVIAELNNYADAGREVIRNGGTVDEAWTAIKAAMVAGGR